MAAVKVYHDKIGNTLTVWFGEPTDEYICEETADEVILMKDQAGKVIGFEKLNYSASDPENVQFSFETVTAWSRPAWLAVDVTGKTGNRSSMDTAETIYELVRAMPEEQANLVLQFTQFVQQQGDISRANAYSQNAW